MSSKSIYGKKMSPKKAKEYEKLLTEFRKHDMLKIYCGIADAHGIESFIPEEDYKAKPFPFQMRADANRQRHAVFYVVELTEDRVETIKELLGKNDYKKALTVLKKLAITIGFPTNRKSSYENSWDLIPNDRLDPYGS